MKLRAAGLFLTSCAVAATGAASAQTQLVPISGIVVAAGSQLPVPGAVVTVTSDAQSGPVAAIADDRGGFSFEVPAGASYTVRASRPGFVEGGFGVDEPGDLPTPVVAKLGADLSRVKIALSRGAVIAGRVMDNEGRALEDHQVSIWQEELPGNWRRVGPLSRTDDLGRFRLFDLAAGRYLVAARRGTELPVFPPDTRALRNASLVNLGMAEDREGVDIKIGPVRSGTLSGVATAMDRPIRASIALTPAGTVGAAIQRVTTDATGAFFFRTLNLEITQSSPK